MTVAAHTPRWIALDGAVNARAVVPGVLLRADSLQALTMERVLELVDERFGGSVAWLSAHGLADADVERLRRRLEPAGQAMTDTTPVSSE